MSSKTIQIEKLLIDLRNNYLADLPARFEEIDNLILGFDKSSDRTEDYENLYRNVHSIKGSSGTHNLHIFSTICHEFEDSLSEHEKNITTISSTDIQSWLKYVDLLKEAHAINANLDNDYSTIELELETLRTASNDNIAYRCLLVSPTKLQKQICESILTDNNTALSVASNGYEALGRLLTTQYDFLIANHEISMLNGLALVAAARLSGNRNKDIQAVLMTSNETLSLNRQTDPDYILIKNNQLAENLSTVVDEMIEHLSAN